MEKNEKEKLVFMQDEKLKAPRFHCIFKMYDLKTISGKASLENRLMESIGQTNHVLINVCSQYNPRLMATQIRNYFQVNPTAIEVLVYKGKKMIVVTRRIAQNPLFLILFQRKYVK